ncbi:hypothetical protein [Candidatus Promineifilum breve]|nr:hypothetical protein [Candidatus Promineifilum breve]
MSTYSATISASGDDARETGGSVNLTGANVTFQANNHYGGLRFVNVTIPAGSTINSAGLTVILPSASFDDPDLTIWGQDSDDAATFTTTANDVSGRTATTATTLWTAGNIGTGAKTSPSLAGIIQEIINRAGWASGNDIALILKANSTSPFRYNAYDGGGADYATLAVDYTAPSGGGQPARTIHQFRQRRV